MIQKHLFMKAITTPLADRFGFFVLCLFFISISLHGIIIGFMRYYQEVFAITFLGLAITHQRNFFIVILKKKPLFYMGLFVLLLIFAALMDPGVSIDIDLPTVEGISHADIDNRLYVLRYAIIFVPMVLYLSVRGLSLVEVSNLCKIITLLTPVSLYSLLYFQGLNQNLGLQFIALTGGFGLGRNAFAPSLTFPFATALYLAFNSKNFIALFWSFFASCIFIFLILSGTRQGFSIAVVTLGLLVFITADRKKAGFLAIEGIAFGAMIYFLLTYIIVNYGLSKFVQMEYSAMDNFSETSRIEIMLESLKQLSPLEYLYGAGLTSVMYSGPHNDYVRWIQRVGVPVMIVGILPYVISLKESRGYFKKIKNPSLKFLVYASLLFTLAHSFFAYPRESVFYGPYCYLGIGLWLAISKGLPPILHSTTKKGDTEISTRKPSLWFTSPPSRRNRLWHDHKQGEIFHL